MVTKTPAPRTSKAKKPAVQMTEDGQHAVYDSTVTRDTYKKGDVLLFPKVRNWLDKGSLIEAFGKVINVMVFENEVPYIEVSFDDTRKMNKVDLGKDVRRFLLEVK